MASPGTARVALFRPTLGSAGPCVKPLEAAPAGDAAAPLSFESVYEEHLAFVWRSLQRLGLRGAGLDDAVQEVFLIVHRKLPTFEGRSSVKTWLFGIVLRVARNARRVAQRHPVIETAPADEEERADEASGRTPAEHAERNEAVRVLDALLDELGDEKREVFILAEIEQMTAPEIAEAVGITLSNVYGRLRAARQGFEQAIARRHARDTWRHR